MSKETTELREERVQAARKARQYIRDNAEKAISSMSNETKHQLLLWAVEHRIMMMSAAMNFDPKKRLQSVKSFLKRFAKNNLCHPEAGGRRPHLGIRRPRS